MVIELPLRYTGKMTMVNFDNVEFIYPGATDCEITMVSGKSLMVNITYDDLKERIDRCVPGGVRQKRT